MANMFNEDGTYNKTEWKAGDKITAVKLNKIELSLEAINNNDIDRHVEADNRLDDLEESMKNSATKNELKTLETLVKDNKDATDLEIYTTNKQITDLRDDVTSRTDNLEKEFSETSSYILNTIDDCNDRIGEVEKSSNEFISEMEKNIDDMVASSVNDNILEFVEDTVTSSMNDEISKHTASTLSEAKSYTNSEIENVFNQSKEYTDLSVLNANTELDRHESSNHQLFINVKDHGAKGDGTTDDTEAFKTAFSQGNHIIIPPGKYLISNISINEPKIIRGLTSAYSWRTQNKSQTELINNASTDMFINAHWNDGGNSLSFENIVFRGNGTNNGIRGRWDLVVTNCMFENFGKGIYDMHASVIDKCKFWQNKTGLAELTDVRVTNCDISKNEIGIDLTSSNSNMIIDNRIEWNTNYGIRHKSGVFNTINNNQFDRNQIGIHLENATDLTIVGNRFDRSLDYHIYFNGCKGVTIVGNKFLKRDITDDNSGTLKPDKAIKLVSYGDITFVGNDSNTKIFDDSNMQYTSGYFVCEGNYSPNLFVSKTFNFTSSGQKYINMSDIQGNLQTVSGWAYEFDLRVEYNNEMIFPDFHVSIYSGITVTIPDKGATSYNVVISTRHVKQYRVL